MSRVAPLALPWSEEDAAAINAWGGIPTAPMSR